jgi:two-component system LytT family response regulator
VNFNAIIIEDEMPARITLKSYLKKYFPNITIIQEIDNLKDAVHYFKENKETGIVFIDIQLKDGKTTDILNYIDNSRFKTVFTTAHEEYTQVAFKHKSFGYLLKPLDPDDFKEIVERIIKDLTFKIADKQLKITTAGGYDWVETKDIIRCESESNYTKIYVKNKTSYYTVPKTLKLVEQEISNPSLFVRTHQSHLININFILEFEFKKSTIMLNNQERIPISRAFKNDMIDLSKHFK